MVLLSIGKTIILPLKVNILRPLKIRRSRFKKEVPSTVVLEVLRLFYEKPARRAVNKTQKASTVEEEDLTILIMTTKFSPKDFSRDVKILNIFLQKWDNSRALKLIKSWTDLNVNYF